MFIVVQLYFLSGILSTNPLPGGYSADEHTCPLTEKATLWEEDGARLRFVTAWLQAACLRLFELIVRKHTDSLLPSVTNLLHENVWDGARNLHFQRTLQIILMYIRV